MCVCVCVCVSFEVGKCFASSLLCNLSFVFPFFLTHECRSAGHKAACRAVQKQRRQDAQAQLEAAAAEAEAAVGSDGDVVSLLEPPCDHCGEPSVFACAAGCGTAHYCSAEHQQDARFFSFVFVCLFVFYFLFFLSFFLS